MGQTTIKFFICNLLIFSLTLPSFAWAADTIELQDLALPTELKDIGKNTGAVFYSPTSKNKTLMPVHFWGEVGKPGLHFIPIDSKLVKGISFAGGGTGVAKLDDVVVNRVVDGKVKRFDFNLQEGGDIKAHEYTLKPGDTVFIEKDRYYENRAYYTSLIGVAVSIISGLFILKRLEDMKR